jgi:hypothetical protein
MWCGLRRVFRRRWLDGQSFQTKMAWTWRTICQTKMKAVGQLSDKDGVDAADNCPGLEEEEQRCQTN